MWPNQVAHLELFLFNWPLTTNVGFQENHFVNWKVNIANILVQIRKFHSLCVCTGFFGSLGFEGLGFLFVCFVMIS